MDQHRDLVPQVPRPVASGNGPRHALVSISEGHIVRNLLENGLLDELHAEDFDVTLLTPAARIKPFTDRWGGPRVRFSMLHPFLTPSRIARLTYFRRKAARRGLGSLARWLRGLEQSRLARLAQAYAPLLDERPWDAYLATHIHLPIEGPILAAASARGIPTLGIVNSWDNVHKGIQSYPDRALVWNEVNRREMIEREGFAPQSVEAIGVPAFDPYFRPEHHSSREAFCQRLNLDPARPYLLYATIGQFVPFFEETFLLDLLLEMIASGELPRETQVVCRLHPWTRTELFEPYRQHPGVRLSRYETYLPTLNWCPTLEETALAGNLIRHAAVCISPGSTMALEAAVFDTPTLVPIFNQYQPEVHANYYSRFCLVMHFERVVKEGLVPLARDRNELARWIRDYLADKSLLAEARRRFRDEYVPHRDGKAVRRVAQQLSRLAHR